VVQNCSEKWHRHWEAESAEDTKLGIIRMGYEKRVVWDGCAILFCGADIEYICGGMQCFGQILME
jgi:hypothetical protein